MFLRDAGQHWNSIFLLAISQEYFSTHYEQLDHKAATSDFDINDADLQILIAKYFHYNSLIKKELLDGIHLVKPLLNGKEICDLYGIKQGKAIGKIMDEEMQY